MLFYFASVVSFLVIVSKFKPLPAWADEMRLLSLLLCQEFVCHSAKFLRKSSIVVISSILRFSSEMLLRKKLVLAPKVENVEPPEPTSVLDLPELVLECILARLSPAGLCNLGVVCCSLRDKCRSDHLWERHLREKWGRVIGEAARRDWQLYVDLRKDAYCRRSGEGKGKGWIWSLFSSWLKPKVDVSSRERNSLPLDSCMSWYLLLESGKFWFPAQVYNRENGHLGFLLSCYDAELSYDCSTDTFHARYPSHGRRTIVIEDGVPWDRIRAPPLDSPAHTLRPSDCLSDLRPRDHIEIQWRRNKGFPYGWWHGVVGHLESCSGDELCCHCPSNETVVLEFRQYASGSQWRQTTVNRKEHREEGNKTDGFYGGIRKLHDKEEISRWLRLWPAEVLD